MAFNKYAVALIIIGIILISGCAGTKSQQQTPSLASKPFVGGTQGVAVTFQPNTPPSETISTEQTEFLIKLENKGESAAKVRKVSLTGISANAFGIKDPVNKKGWDLTPVGKVSNTLIPGGQDIVSFTSPKYSGALEGQFAFTATAAACYDYKSQGVSTACITDNLLQQATGANACKTSGVKTVYNKGAPIQVTSVEQIPFGKDTLGFQIKLKNVGSGNAYHSQSCDEKTTTSGSTVTNINKIVVTSVKLGSGVVLDCSRPDKLVSLVNGEAILVCKTSPGALKGKYTGVVEDLLTIDLDYDYESQGSVKFTVKALPQ